MTGRESEPPVIRYDLRTGWELRAFVLGLIHAGWSQADAAAECEIMAQQAHQYVHKPRSERSRRLSTALDVMAPRRKRCIDCGRERNTGSAASEGRCAGCLAAHHEAIREARRMALVEVAEETGFIPNATEASVLLGVARSTAGTLLAQTFGPDPRDGWNRHERRPYVPQEVVDVAV